MHAKDTLSFVDVRFIAYNKDPDNNNTLANTRYSFSDPQLP